MEVVTVAEGCGKIVLFMGGDMGSSQRQLVGLLTEQLSKQISNPKILNYKPSSSGVLTGKVASLGRVFNFIIQGNTVSVKPSAGRTDSALFSELYLEINDRLDARSTKQLNPNCGAKSYRCKGDKGVGCIPVTNHCRRTETDAISKERLLKIRVLTKELASSGGDTAKLSAAEASVKSGRQALADKNKSERTPKKTEAKISSKDVDGLVEMLHQSKSLPKNEQKKMVDGLKAFIDKNGHRIAKEDLARLEKASRNELKSRQNAKEFGAKKSGRIGKQASGNLKENLGVVKMKNEERKHRESVNLAVHGTKTPTQKQIDFVVPVKGNKPLNKKLVDKYVDHLKNVGGLPFSKQNSPEAKEAQKIHSSSLAKEESSPEAQQRWADKVDDENKITNKAQNKALKELKSEKLWDSETGRVSKMKHAWELSRTELDGQYKELAKKHKDNPEKLAELTKIYKRLRKASYSDK